VLERFETVCRARHLIAEVQQRVLQQLDRIGIVFD
jgi:hypothetical protein